MICGLIQASFASAALRFSPRFRSLACWAHWARALSASGDVRRVAFYFSQPPPLRPPEPGSMSLPESGLGGRPAGPFGAFRRTSKRRHMRTNLGYLTTANAGHKAVIQAWVDEIGARMRAG